jgi:hypothetical protein
LDARQTERKVFFTKFGVVKEASRISYHEWQEKKHLKYKKLLIIFLLLFLLFILSFSPSFSSFHSFFFSFFISFPAFFPFFFSFPFPLPTTPTWLPLLHLPQSIHPLALSQ